MSKIKAKIKTGAGRKRLRVTDAEQACLARMTRLLERLREMRTVRDKLHLRLSENLVILALAGTKNFWSIRYYTQAEFRTVIYPMFAAVLHELAREYTPITVQLTLRPILRAMPGSIKE